MIKNRLMNFTMKLMGGKRRIVFASIATIIVLLATLAPINITYTPDQGNALLTIGRGKYIITIGNLASAQEADYTCDGTADDVQFQQALDALSSIGGQLFVYAGAYNWTASTTVTRAIDNVSIVGVGAAVSFNGDATTPIFTAGGDNWLFCNLKTDAGGVSTGSTTDWMQLNVTLGATYYPLRTDGINIEDHSSLHGVGGSDTVFPADPGADKFLMWDDVPGQLSWEDAGTQLTQEEVEDYVGGMVTGNTETLIDVTYEDGDGTLDFVVDDDLSLYDNTTSGFLDTVDISDDTNLTAGDALTLTGDDIDFDGGATPGGELGGTWASPTVDSGIHDDEYIELTDSFSGDVSGTYDAVDITESVLGVGGSDTVYPADPNADKFLMWDDDPGQLSWESVAGGGDMLKSTYDTDDDGDIDTAAGGTEWDSSAVTGVAYITAGAWGTRSTGISNTYILVVDGTPNDDEYARFTASGLEGRTESEFKSDYNLEIGTDVQAYDAELQAIAGLTSAADKLIYFTGSGTADTSDLTAFARTILDDANEATFKATVNLEIGTDVAAQTHASQHAVSGSDTVYPADPNADKFLMWDDDPGQLSWESVAGGGDMLKSTYDTDDDGDIDTAAGGTEWDSSAVTGVAYITGGSWSAVAKGIADTNFVVIDGNPNDDEYARFTANGLEGRTEAEFKADFNLEIGTDVLAYDATLSSISDLGTGADKLAYTTGVDTWAETGLTAFARSILDDADEATFKATVNLEIGTDVLAQQTIGIGDDNLVEMDDADAADNDYARFTAAGLEGRDYSEVLSDLSGQADATFDWNGQTLADWGIESGATVDASPTIGQFFLHTPTGRSVLLQYSGSAWVPIQSFGTMAMYVDSTDGTDGINYGTGVDSDAFATINYAVDQIPGMFSGHVTININNETYAEAVTIAGKKATGDYHISLVGTVNSAKSGTTDNEATYNYEGNAAAYSILYDSGGFGADYEDHLVYVDSTDYRIIDKMCYSMGFEAGQNGMEPDPGEPIKGDASGAWGVVVYVDTQAGSWAGSDASGVIYYVPISGTFQDDETVDVMTDSDTIAHNNAFNVEEDNGAVAQDLTKAALCGCLSSTPTNQTYVIYSWGTTVNSIDINNPGAIVQLYRMKFAGSATYPIQTQCCTVSPNGCYFTGSYPAYFIDWSRVSLTSCLLDPNTNRGTQASRMSSVDLLRCKLKNVTGREAVLYAISSSYIIPAQGTVIDGGGSSAGCNYGVYVRGNSFAVCFSTDANGFARIRRCDNAGIYANIGGKLINYSDLQVLDNAADVSEDATSFGYVDD